MPQDLTVLAAIRPGDEARLRQALRPLGDDIRGRRLSDATQRPGIDFGRMRACHFARFAIVDDPDRGPDRRRLLYSSVYDGALDDHTSELAAVSRNLDAIWGCCEGYVNRARFAEFVRAHEVRAEAFYIAFHGESVSQIVHYIARRRETELVLDQAPPAPAAPVAAMSQSEPSAGVDLPVRKGPLASAVARLVRALPLVLDVFEVLARCGPRDVYLGTRRITASLNRYAVFRWFNRLTRNPAPRTDPIYSSARLDTCAPAVPMVAGDEFPSAQDHTGPAFREDVVAQNQLTVLTVVRPGMENRVRAVMAAIHAYARRLSPDGALIGVSTIHFVRWVLLDGGRRLVLLSDYDGSWEAYIDEFAEMILSGLDAIWETSFGYPADGARDLPAFKQFLRNHQVPSEVFFSAYPGETVLNILNDRAEAISPDTAHSAAAAARGLQV